MEDERVFIIGDIHGCLDMFKSLMDKIEWRPDKDRLIFLGDYVDRGANPKGVVDHILYLTKCSDHIECLMGNHEEIFLDYLNKRNSELFIRNGGWNTVASYQADKSKEDKSLVPANHIAFLNSLESFIELEEYYVVHAGFRPGIDVKDQSLEDMIWIRETFVYSDYDFGKKVIFGHTPFHEPLVMENKIGIDTGAVYGNTLTCLELPEFRFHSVEV
jgi:serine/threonine protein phosphatase 1